MKIKDVTLVSIFGALLCIISPIAIPIGTIPITFSMLVIYVIGALFSPFKALLTVLVYLFMGLIGLPVFSGYVGGPSVLLSPTGGFLIGYILCVLVISIIVKIKDKPVIYPVAMALGTMICYLVGTVYYMYIMDASLIESLVICVIPFIIFDIIKIVFATIISIILKKKIVN